MAKDGFKYVIYGVIILVGIVLALAFGSKLINKESDSNYTYNGFSFVEYNNMYQTQIMLYGNEDTIYNLEFRYGPKDLEDIPVIGEPKYFLNVDSMYVAFDPYDYNLTTIGVASADIQMNLARVLGKGLVAACTREHEDCVNVSIMNCTNTDGPIIIVRHDPVALVEQDGNCLIVQGPEMDVVRSADRLMYYLYGIMG